MERWQVRYDNYFKLISKKDSNNVREGSEYAVFPFPSLQLVQQELPKGDQLYALFVG